MADQEEEFSIIPKGARFNPYPSLQGLLQSTTPEEREENVGGWAFCPDIILEQIFAALPIRNRARAGMACRHWLYVLQTSDRCWNTFVYQDTMFTRSKFTLANGWAQVLDHWKLRFLINNATRRWRHLIIKPAALINNMYEFVKVLTNVTEFYEQHDKESPLDEIRSFDFEWKMEFLSEKRAIVYGTGGQILANVTHLLTHMRGLKYLALRALLLDDDEAEEFMEELLGLFQESLSTLTLINITKTHHSFLHIGLFLALEKLRVSPQHLNDNVILALGSNQCLTKLILVQDDKTKGIVPVASAAWKQAKKMSPALRVHLRIRGRNPEELVWQLEAPVESIVYDTPKAQLTNLHAMIIAENYSDYLKFYVQRGYQRRFRSKKLEERADSASLMIVRHCPCLEVLGLREHISTATALLLAQHSATNNPNRFHLCIRRNALLKRCDWPYDSEQWTRKFYSWLKVTSRNYEATNREIGKLYGTDWHALTDNEYLQVFRYRTG